MAAQFRSEADSRAIVERVREMREEMVTPPTESRLGRTALIVLAISLGMFGALSSLEQVARVNTYDQVVLKILAITVGVVGAVWAFVLLVRGMARDEPMVLPFTIFLIVFAGLSIPLIQTWATVERGGENGWYFLHLACVPLVVPLLTIAFLFATPLFAWKYRRASRSDGAQRAGLKRRAWRALFLVAGVFFAAAFPISFYVYGGTMAEFARGEHWTTKVVHTLPRLLGDIGYRVLQRMPEKTSRDTEGRPIDTKGLLMGLLISRGLVSANFLTETIELLSQSSEQDPYFNHFARNYPTEAFALARENFKNYPPKLQCLEMARHFAQFASDGEVREYLSVERYNVLTMTVQWGLRRGLLERANAKDFVPDAEKLFELGNIDDTGGDPLTSGALTLLMKHADDATAKRVYQEAIERKDESLGWATLCLHEFSRMEVIAAGISQPDMGKQLRVLQTLLALQTHAPYIQLMRIRNDASCRLALLRNLDSPNIDTRVMNALIIHQLSNVLSPMLIQKYKLRSSTDKLLRVTPVQLLTVDLLERNLLIAQARELMRKW